MVQNQSKNSSYNKVAKELKDRRYHQRVVRSKKVYDRQKIKKVNQDSHGDS
jgi:anthranilate/para-aminobenzoate synthase component II